MLFNSYSFLFLFLPLVVAVFFLIPVRRVRLGLIVLSSFVFYGAAGLQHAVVLGIEIIWVYALTCAPAIVGNRVRLTACVVPVFAGLVYYKYAGFLVADVLMLNSTDAAEAFNMFSDAVLPAGISFFTFQLAAFAFDRFRGNVERPPSLFAFAAYISFFPQLIAGPNSGLRGGQQTQPLVVSEENRLSRAAGLLASPDEKLQSISLLQNVA